MRARFVWSVQLAYADGTGASGTLSPDAASTNAFCLTLRFCAAYNQLIIPEISAGDVDQAEIQLG
jgi:hypothetical protein